MASGSRRRGAGPSTGSPSTRGCASGSTGARSTWGRRRPTSAARPRSIGTAAGDRGRTARRRRRASRSALPAPRGASAMPRRRQRLHRARLRRLHRSLVALDGGLGGLALPGDRRLHRRRQPRLLAAEPDRELGQRPDRRRLAPDPYLRRPAGADQQLQQLRQAQLQPRDRPGGRSGGRRGRPGERGRDGARQPDLLRHGVLHPHLERHRRHPRLPRGLDRKAALARLRLRRLQQQRLRDRRPRRPRSARGYNLPDHLWFANWNGQATTLDSYVPSQRLDPAPAHPPVPRRPRRDLRRGDDQHRQQLRRRRHRRQRRRRRAAKKTRSATSTWPARRSPARFGSRAGRSTAMRRPKSLAIRAFVGGQAGTPGAEQYELGAVANQARLDVGCQVPDGRRAARLRPHLPDPQIRARNRSASTRSTPAAAPTACSAARPSRSRSRSRSRWSRRPRPASRSGSPANGRKGPQCPGQLALRTRIKVALPHRRGTPPRIRAVTRSLGRRAFNLSGKRGHGYMIPLSAGGRALLRQRGSLKAQLITAIPGGRRVAHRLRVSR